MVVMVRYCQSRVRFIRFAANRKQEQRLEEDLSQRDDDGMTPAHDVAAFILQQLEDTLESGVAAGIFNVQTTFDDKRNLTQLETLASEQLFDWLRDNGLTELLFEVTYKSLCLALARDLIEFAAVALKAAKAQLFTPAFALLRKPFKDNLFYLEWMLADIKDFMSRFTGRDLDQLTVGSLSESQRLDIIRYSLEAIACRNWIEPSLLYDLRFDKKSKTSLELFWQKATHLITTQGAALRTEPENFNFVFSDQKARDSQRQWFYGTVPALLFHALQIIEALIANFASRSEPDLVPLQTLAGMTLWMYSPARFLDLRNTPRKFCRIVARTLRTLRCFACGRRISASVTNITALFENLKVTCSGCGQDLSLYVQPAGVTEQNTA